MYPGAMPMRQPPCESFPSPGVTMPGQFGPMSRVLLPCITRFTRTMSFTGIPSVMQTTSVSPASTPSRIASAAKGGGTTIAEAVAPVSFIASATVSKIGTLFSNSCPRLPGVTPATTCVPYARLSCACRAPKLPVMPWTRILVWGVTRMAMQFISLTSNRLDNLLRRVRHRVPADERQTRVSEDLLSDLHVVAFEPHDERNAQVRFARGSDDTGSDDVALHDATENVHENSLHVRIAENDAERRRDLFF